MKTIIGLLLFIMSSVAIAEIVTICDPETGDCRPIIINSYSETVL